MTVELRHLRYLLAVAETGSLNRAAGVLHMSQPPLTRQLRALERAVGEPLLQRSPRGSVLTPAGRRLAEAAARIVADVDAALTAARSRPVVTGELRIAFHQNLAVPVATPLLSAVRATHPGTSIAAHTLDRYRSLEALEAGQVDLALLRSPFADPALRVVPLYEEDVAVAVPAGHGLTRRRSVQLRDLDGSPWITVGTPGAYDRRAEMERRCADAGLVPAWGPRVNDLQAALALVGAGVGVFVGPASTASIGPPGLAFVPVTGWTSQVLAVSRPSPPAVVRAAVDLARQLPLPGLVRPDGR